MLWLDVNYYQTTAPAPQPSPPAKSLQQAIEEVLDPSKPSLIIHNGGNIPLERGYSIEGAFVENDARQQETLATKATVTLRFQHNLKAFTPKDRAPWCVVYRDIIPNSGDITDIEPSVDISSMDRKYY
jgi:hypothetical protein